MNISCRNIEKTDLTFLREMLYEALFVPPDAQPFPKSILDTPEISKYLENWGRRGDFGLIVEANHERVGAIWGRLFSAAHPGYGFIDEKTPELSMAIKEEYRGTGIGTILLEEFISIARENGYRRLSLSVDMRNRARALYQRVGFKIAREQGTAFVMKKFL